MDTNKIIGLSSKVIVGILLIVGVIMCVMVLKDGNPRGWNEQTKYDVGEAIVAKGNAAETMSPKALEDEIRKVGNEKHQEVLARQTAQASSTLTFTMWILGITVALIVIALILSIILNPKGFIIPAIAAVVFGLVLLLIYMNVSTDVPAGFAQIDADNLANSSTPEDFEPVFTTSSWKLAGAAIWSSIFLAGVAVVGIIVSSVVKLVK